MSQEHRELAVHGDVRPIRIGLVSYLNVQPMIWALQKEQRSDIQFQSLVPRKLAEALSDGTFDTAIVPVFEYLRNPDKYYYLSGTAIAARNPVKSVMLYSSVVLEDIQEVYLDTSSLTSVHLCQVLLAEKQISVKIRDMSQKDVPLPLPNGTAWVVIGDPALRELGKHRFTYDLAELWQQHTGFPFVFAAWLVPRNAQIIGLAKLLTESTLTGLANLRQVAEDVAEKFGTTPDFALDYFQNNIHYLLEDFELNGWKEFARLCYKHNLIETCPELVSYPFG